MKKLLPLLLLPLLVACAPSMQEATLSLSPDYVQLRQGQSTTVSVWFNKYLYGDEQKDGYDLFVTGTRGLRVTTYKTQLNAKDTATFTITAAQNADLGKQSINVVVTNRQGHNVQRSLTVNVVP